MTDPVNENAPGSEPLRFDLIGVDLSLSLAVAYTGHRHAVGWRVDPGRNRMVLFWSAKGFGAPGVQQFPTPLGPEAVEPLVRAWLESVDYGREPDHDGSNRKGWRVFNERWGYVNDWSNAFVGIEPVWLEFHK